MLFYFRTSRQTRFLRFVVKLQLFYHIREDMKNITGIKDIVSTYKHPQNQINETKCLNNCLKINNIGLIQKIPVNFDTLWSFKTAWKEESKL